MKNETDALCEAENKEASPATQAQEEATQPLGQESLAGAAGGTGAFGGLPLDMLISSPLTAAAAAAATLASAHFEDLAKPAEE